MDSSLTLLGFIQSALLIGLICIAGMLALVIWPEFDPAPPVTRLFDSLIFHIAAAGVVLSALLALSGWRVTGLAFALLIIGGAAVFGWRHLPSSYFKSPEPPQGPVVKVLSFNVLFDNMEAGPDIAQMLREQDADFAVLLEAGPMLPQIEGLKDVYPYHQGCVDEDTCDLLLLSKHPFDYISQTSLERVPSERLIRARVTLPDGTILPFVAVHLSKPYFDEMPLQELWSMLRQTRRGFHKGHPYVMAGDFNAPVWARHVRRSLQHRKAVSGPQPVASWPVRFGNYGVQIDQILGMGGAVPISIEPLPQAFGSNHRGLVAQIAIPSQSTSQ